MLPNSRSGLRPPVHEHAVADLHDGVVGANPLSVLPVWPERVPMLEEAGRVFLIHFCRASPSAGGTIAWP